MSIRLIALDIDGTLLDSRSQISPRDRKAVEEAALRGLEVALVTGRRYHFALPIAEQLRCPLTMIVNNGALIRNKEGRTELRHLLPRDTAHKVLQSTPEFRSGAAIVFDRPRANQVIYERIDWEDPARRGYFLRNHEFLAEVAPLEEALIEDPIQVMYSGPVDAMRRAEAALRRMEGEGGFSLAVTYYDMRDFGMVDVVRTRCSKGATLAEWAALRGLAREEVMAIGDNLNDREMLEFAGLPVVMGNAVPELKTQGWRETLSNDQGGVAAAITAYVLGKPQRSTS